jgi:hypothetical protein
VENNALEILGGRFSVYYDGAEVLRDIVPTTIECQHMPPYDHFVYTFEARTTPQNFQYFGELVNGSAISHTMCKISNGFAECDAYIDSYEVRQNPIELMDMSGRSLVLPPSHHEIIIRGHVMGESNRERDLPSKRRFKKKEPEPIESRFDILDL